MSSSSAASTSRAPIRNTQPSSALPTANGNRKRPRTPPREASPPFIQFGPSESAAFAPPSASTSYRAIGKPILWGLIASDSDITPTEQEKVLEERQRAHYAKFREHYVSRLIDRFGGSLDEIRRKEGEDLKESRLAVLIRAIADGSDAFTSKDGQGIWRVGSGKEGTSGGERELVLEGLGFDNQEAQGAREDGDAEMA